MNDYNYTNQISAEKVSNSIECVRCRRYAKFFAVACAVLLVELALIIYIFNIDEDLNNGVEVYCLLGAMFGLGLVGVLYFIISNVSRLKAIERGVGVLPVYKVVFETVKTSEIKGTRFILEVPNGSGKTVETQAIFLSNKPNNHTGKPRTLVPPLYVEDFVGKEVLVMYNPDKNKVYVLDFADKYNLTTDTF